MSNRNAFVFFIAVFLAVAAVLGGVIWFLTTRVGLENSLLWTAILTGFGWLIVDSIRRGREHERLQADQKREMYFQLLDFTLSALKEVRGGAKANEVEEVIDIDKLTQWNLRLALIGSDDVVRTWNDFKSQSTGDHNPQNVLEKFAALLKAMRQDCGHFSTGLEHQDLLALIIKSDELKSLSAK